jgi:hypothetical protein
MNAAPKTFKCEHFSVGNVASAKCHVCGDLEPVENSRPSAKTINWNSFYGTEWNKEDE